MIGNGTTSGDGNSRGDNGDVHGNGNGNGSGVLKGDMVHQQQHDQDAQTVGHRSHRSHHHSHPHTHGHHRVLSSATQARGRRHSVSSTKPRAKPSHFGLSASVLPLVNTAWFRFKTWLLAQIPEQRHPPLTGVSCCLAANNKWRVRVAQFVYHPAAQGFVLLCIILSSVFLAMVSPMEDTPPAIALFEALILAVFILEFLLKAFALGFGPYIRDSWNRVDFLVVLLGILEVALAGSGAKVSVVRLVRIARPVRALKWFEGAVAIVRALLRGLRLIVNVLLVLVFLYTLFTAFGLETLDGSLRRRCVTMSDGIPVLYEIPGPEPPLFCNFENDDKGGFLCADAPVGNANVNLTCVDLGYNPSTDLLTFDNVGLSFYTVFQISTLEGWSELAMFYQDAEFPLSIGFFVAVIVFANFFVINMSFGIIYLVFSAGWEQYESKLRMRRIDPAQELSKLHLPATTDPSPTRTPRMSEVSKPPVIARMVPYSSLESSVPDTPVNGRPNHSRNASKSGQKLNAVAPAPVVPPAAAVTAAADALAPASTGPTVTSVSTIPSPAISPRLRGGQFLGTKVAEQQLQLSPPPASSSLHSFRKIALSPVPQPHEPEPSNNHSCWATCCSCWRSFHNEIRHLGKSVVFEVVTSFFIIMYACLLSVDKVSASQRTLDVLNTLETIVIIMFGIELYIRLVAGGWRSFFSMLNALDAIVIVVSVLFLAVSAQDTKSGDDRSDFTTFVELLPILRIFRVLRVFMLVPRTKRLIQTAFRSLNTIAHLVFLTLFAAFVYAIIGMQLFGGRLKLDDQGRPPRVNFDSFGESLLALFIIATGENWNSVYTDLLESSRSWAATPYVVLWLLMSSFVLLNLFVAVILENFQIAEADKAAYQEHLLHLAAEDHKDAEKEAAERRALLKQGSVPQHQHRRPNLRIDPARASVTSLISLPSARLEFDVEAGAMTRVPFLLPKEGDISNAPIAVHHVGDAPAAPLPSERSDEAQRDDSKPADDTVKAGDGTDKEPGPASAKEGEPISTVDGAGAGAGAGGGQGGGGGTANETSPAPSNAMDFGSGVGELKSPSMQLSSEAGADSPGGIDARIDDLAALLDSGWSAQTPMTPDTGRSLATPDTVPNPMAETAPAAMLGEDTTPLLPQGPEEKKSRPGAVNAAVRRLRQRYGQPDTSRSTGKTGVTSGKRGLRPTRGGRRRSLESRRSREGGPRQPRRRLRGAPSTVSRSEPRRGRGQRRFRSSASRQSTQPRHRSAMSDAAAIYGAAAPGPSHRPKPAIRPHVRVETKKHRDLWLAAARKALPTRHHWVAVTNHARAQSAHSELLRSDNRASAIRRAQLEFQVFNVFQGRQASDRTRSPVPLIPPTQRRWCACKGLHSCSKRLADRARGVWSRIRQVVTDADDKAFNCMGPDHWFRKPVYAFVKSNTFRIAVMLTVLAASVFMSAETFEDKTNPSSTFKIADAVFAVLFSLEVILKLIAFGVFLTPEAFFKSTWNWFSFIIAVGAVVEAVTGIRYDGVEFAFVADFDRNREVCPNTSTLSKAVRLIRALRPLKCMEYFTATRQLIESLILGFPDILAAMAIVFVLYFAFAVIGRDLFGHRFRACNDPSIRWKADCAGVFLNDEGELTLRRWEDQTTNFNTITESMSALFEVASLEGWISVMQNAMDVTGIDRQPARNASPGAAIYFVAYIFIATFVVLNIFVGIILENMSRVRGMSLLTTAQRQWIHFSRLLTAYIPSSHRKTLEERLVSSRPKRIRRMLARLRRVKSRRILPDEAGAAAVTPPAALISPKNLASRPPVAFEVVDRVSPTDGLCDSSRVEVAAQTDNAASAPLSTGPSIGPGGQDASHNRSHSTLPVEGDRAVAWTNENGVGTPRDVSVDGRGDGACDRPVTATSTVDDAADVARQQGSRRVGSEDKKASKGRPLNVEAPLGSAPSPSPSPAPSDTHASHAIPPIKLLRLGDPSGAGGAGQESKPAGASLPPLTRLTPREAGSVGGPLVVAHGAAAPGRGVPALSPIKLIPDSNAKAPAAASRPSLAPAPASGPSAAASGRSTAPTTTAAAQPGPAVTQQGVPDVADASTGASNSGHSKKDSVLVPRPPRTSPPHAAVAALTPLVLGSSSNHGTEDETRIDMGRGHQSGKPQGSPNDSSSGGAPTPSDSSTPYSSALSSIADDDDVVCADVQAAFASLRHLCFDIVVPCHQTKERCPRTDQRLHWLHGHFDDIVLGIIVLNFVVLATKHNPQSDAWTDFQDLANLAFFGLFLFEIALRLLAMGIRDYFRDPWNTFDIFVAVGTGVTLVYSLGIATQLSRVFRLGRLFRVVRASATLRVLFMTLLVSARALLNVTALVFLAIFAYAVIGMEFFGAVGFEESEMWAAPEPTLADLYPSVTLASNITQQQLDAFPLPLEGINRHQNFRSLGGSLFLMFRVATGEDWQTLYHDCQRCSVFATLFFFSFVVLITYILLNFYLGTVWQHFEHTYTLQNGAVSFADLELYRAVWRQFDAKNEGHIRFKDVRKMLLMMSQPVLSSMATLKKQAADVVSNMPDEKFSRKTRKQSKKGNGSDSDKAGAGKRKKSNSRRRRSRRRKKSRRPTSNKHALMTTAGNLLAGSKRTEFQEYMFQGLMCKSWWAIVRLELRTLALQYTITHRLVTHAKTNRSTWTAFSLDQDGNLPGHSRRGSFEKIVTECWELPEEDLFIPFGEVLSTLVKWRLGAACLPTHERLQRELQLKLWYRSILVSNVQALVRGYLARLRWRMEHCSTGSEYSCWSDEEGFGDSYDWATSDGEFESDGRDTPAADAGADADGGEDRSCDDAEEYRAQESKGLPLAPHVP